MKFFTIYRENKGLNTTSFNKSPLEPIQCDQEILNLELSTLNDNELSIIGKEGMGFQDPIYLMVHCTSAAKHGQKIFYYHFKNSLKKLKMAHFKSLFLLFIFYFK